LEDWRKPKPTDGLVSRYINRKISTRITGLILKYDIPLTPNQATLISLLTALITAYIIYLGQPIVGGIMIEVSSIIDGVDGELARAKHLGSRLGGFLDAMMDRIADISIIVALSYEALINHPLKLGSTFIGIIALLALSGDLLVSYLHARGEASLGIHPSKIGVLRGFASRDVRLLIMAALETINLGLIALIIVTIISYIYVIGKIIEVYFHTANRELVKTSEAIT
jgi:CDP-L-myo-inositol myo-inositolphosphotransferase